MTIITPIDDDQFNVITEIRYFRLRDPKMLLRLLRLDGVKEFFNKKNPLGIFRKIQI